MGVIVRIQELVTPEMRLSKQWLQFMTVWVFLLQLNL